MSRVDAFRKLHDNVVPLRLPNAWDAGSARLIESLGAQAVATTSAGFAWALGYADGRQLPTDEVVGEVRRIMRVLKVPLTVDIENGYSDDPASVARFVMQLVDLGIAGINIEDGPDDPALLEAKLAAIRDALAKSGNDLYVNARCDVFLASLVDKPLQVDESIARGKRYVSAGADGLFLPALSEPHDIEKIVAAVRAPLNVMVVPGLADAQTLGRLGVRRLSAGGAITQLVFDQTRTLAKRFLHDGESEPLGNGMAYSEIQGLFANSGG
ncbi:isocitrate lyase/PEP mutase family protein [Paraburkholderia sp. ZP32-5]|uniref:isocitrate lyase/PEP mutase family protein n=1 Tax=Paraburkholderia sp. ZP32-5 TaxID=2883245 RepID=UPI001F264C29|nr:isocitrate lyase/phosphoenolpyruvate mutase family protein [Paraburkholderia sp. ZP32-5]